MKIIALLSREMGWKRYLINGTATHITIAAVVLHSHLYPDRSLILQIILCSASSSLSGSARNKNMGSSVDLLPLESNLTHLAATIRDAESKLAWQDVETISQTLANNLRARDGLVDHHTILGKTQLPGTLTSLLSLALHGSHTPTEPYVNVTFELLRVGANLCMDHDENRGYLLEAGFPQIVLNILEGYADLIPSPPPLTPLTLSIPHLKVIRTAIGVLLNAILGYDAVKFRLLSLEASLTILRLSSAIYPPTLWARSPAQFGNISNEDLEESWILRSGISNWAWRTVSELKDVKDESLQAFTPDVLPWIIPSLSMFVPPNPPNENTAFAHNASLLSTLLHTDFEVLEESCTLIESLSLDVEDIRLALARGFCFPAEHLGVPCFSTMLEFIEYGDYPPLWKTTFTEPERKRKEKAFDICKAGLIKSVVEVAGEERNGDVLWDESEEKPGGEFVCKMVRWIKEYVEDIDRSAKNPASDSPGSHRDDMVICASLALGNLARREKFSTALLSPPHSLAPVLASAYFFSPAADVKLKHGILGLLKHLAQSSTLSPTIHTSLGDAGIIRRITESDIWSEKANAMADIVQLNAIGVVKHMCNASVEHSFTLVLPPTDRPTYSVSGLSQIIALVSRSDSVPIQSEGTRVLVNVVKSLWSSEWNNGAVSEEKKRRREAAIRAVLIPEYISALAGLIGRSGRYPILVNEGVVALTLICTHGQGGPLVLSAITAPLLPHNPSVAEPSSATSSDASSPLIATPPTRAHIPAPRHALDMLISVLRNVDNPVNYPIEVRMNTCSFFVQLAKHTSGPGLESVEDFVRPILEKTVESGEGKGEKLAPYAKRVLDSWA